MPIHATTVSLYPTATGGDMIKPGKPVVTLLSTGSPNLQSAVFHTDHTPGDNGFTGGTAYAFRTAFSGSPIVTESDWMAAFFFEPVWFSNSVAANAAQDFTVEFPEPGPWYFAVRFRDVAGNVGGISNSVAVTV